ncbi:ABC transporter ATP-binding protein [Pseudothauera nasutitermitis]|uniref:ABC transporter ATP-binding protein n=1 Tax=Pseudothauera nasutitermitis TaxID=2565930 RepID=A0A4S4AX65_9RHOO|nr:ABC transporter ATP-binding protein [Pseudothauera nasutitermitis]THF64634.1 ABC transporter ATP-binding protein [Pseudothauera nasutitermitis]
MNARTPIPPEAPAAIAGGASLLRVDALSVRRGAATLVDAVSLELERGELFGLIGPNGAGKSSLLRAIAQLIPHGGACRLDGDALGALPAEVRARRLAYLAQGDHVVWPLRVRDFVALGRQPHGRKDANGAAAVEAALARMHLRELAGRRLDALSGGERARARLARALAVEASLLLADEPVAALDPYHQLSVMELLRQQCARGHSIVVVLHDLTLASRFCHRVLLMHQGRAVACGAPRQVLTPANLQRVYQVQAMHGEHEAQPYVLPWRCEPTNG